KVCAALMKAIWRVAGVMTASLGEWTHHSPWPAWGGKRRSAVPMHALVVEAVHLTVEMVPATMQEDEVREPEPNRGAPPAGVERLRDRFRRRIDRGPHWGLAGRALGNPHSTVAFAAGATDDRLQRPV